MQFSRISIIKSVKVALGIKCYNLGNKCIKSLAVFIPCNKKLQEVNNFGVTMKNTSKVRALWRLRKMSLEGKIVMFQQK